MDFIIVFFRDILSGPLYIAIVVINSILICSCIGYLGEQYLNRKKSKIKYDETHATIDVNSGINVNQPIQQENLVNNDNQFQVDNNHGQ